jgi:hypothetical protein
MTQRWRPRWVGESMPGRASRAAMRRWRRSARTYWLLYALSPCSLAGRVRRRPRRERMGVRLSSSGTSRCASWTLAADASAVNGSPPRSDRTWTLLPGLPRSTGFCPVRSPSSRLVLRSSRPRLVTSRSDRGRRVGPVRPGAGVPTGRLGSTRRSGGGRWPGSPRTSPRVASTTNTLLGSGTGSPPGPAGRPPGVAHHLVGVPGRVGSAAPRAATGSLVPTSRSPSRPQGKIIPASHRTSK